MITSTIRHGDICIEFLDDGSVRLVRQSSAQAVDISPSEWCFLLKIAEIQGWPIAPPRPQ